jgi:hypothetical protein
VKPFMTAEDLMAYGDAHSKFRDTLNQLDFALESQRVEGEYEKTNIAKGAVQSRAEANDLAAARGLFHSSVRDAELYDINATAALRQNYLDRQLDTAQIQTQTQKVAAQNAWDDFQRGMNQKEVQNAQEVMANTPQYLVDPTKPKPASGYKPRPIGPRPERPNPRPNHHGFRQGGGGAPRPQQGGNRPGHNRNRGFRRGGGGAY